MPIKCIDEQYIGSLIRLRHGGNKNRAVAIDDAQPRIIEWDLKMRSQGNYSLINFDDRQARGGQMAMAKLGQGATAEADHENLSGPSAEEQKAHHLTGVGTDQDLGVVEPHLALNGTVNSKTQRSGFTILDQKWFVVTVFHQALA